MRRPFIAGNWKMNKSCAEAIILTQILVDSFSKENSVEICIAPAFTALHVVSNVLNKSNISMVAQDVFWERDGAFTGEISASMLKNVGCDYVIVGHSERRCFFSETDRIINKKLKAALFSDIYPIFCVGETKADREQGKTFSVIDKQIKVGTYGVSHEDFSKVILAYEPTWAIGTGETATENQIQDVHVHIRSFLREKYSSNLAKNIRIIYGGSVSIYNVVTIMSIPDVDGVLVGGSSLEAEVFVNLVHLVCQSRLHVRG